jgi:hypothetical protein
MLKSSIKLDDLVKSPIFRFDVIPVKTEIQLFQIVMDSRRSLSRTYSGAVVTRFFTFYEAVKLVKQNSLLESFYETLCLFKQQVSPCRQFPPFQRPK